MARTRSIAITALAVALAALGQQVARSQSPSFGSAQVASGAKAEATCVVYPLSDLGHDPNLTKWLAATIPNVIQPGSWGEATGTKITYYAPARVLVVYHHAAVHTQVKAFLADMKGAMHEEKGTIHLRKAPVVQAEYTEAAPPKPAHSAGAGYPVPAPQTQPKHLFHLILRYEGDGLSDEAVTGLVKQISDAGVVKADSDAKPKSEPARGPSLGQLLHFIVRYEGDGIVDANVVALMKELYGANKDAGSRFAVPMTAGPGYGPPSGASPGFATNTNGGYGSPSGSSPGAQLTSGFATNTNGGVGGSNAPPASQTGGSAPGWARQPVGGSSTAAPASVPPTSVTQPGSNPAQSNPKRPATTSSTYPNAP